MLRHLSLVCAMLVCACASGAVTPAGQACLTSDDCDPGDGCLAGVCAAQEGEDVVRSGIVVATPAHQTIRAMVDEQPRAARVHLHDADTLHRNITVSCPRGFVPSPASAQLAPGESLAVTVALPIPRTEGNTTVTCLVQSATTKTTYDTFDLELVIGTTAPPSDGGSDGGAPDAGHTDGGSDGGHDGGADAGTDGGADAGTDGGADAGTDGGADAGTDGGADAGTDGGADAGTDGGADAGTDGGPIGPTGGAVDLLDFVLTGDTRPPTCAAGELYPTAVHAQVIAAMKAAHPQFALDLGDHMYVCSQDAAAAQRQMDLYTQPLAGFPAPFFMTMGNHECENGADCSARPTDANFSAFSKALARVSGQSLPYYALQIQTRLGRATVVVVADNYFDATAQAWLERTLADADRGSKYTIISKHHPVTGSRMGPLGPWQVIQNHQVSLILTAHDHTYTHDKQALGGRTVICGLGGANAAHTGYCRVKQASDGSLSFTQFDVGGNPGDAWTVTARQ